jgi:hypothetical protein
VKSPLQWKKLSLLWVCTALALVAPAQQPSPPAAPTSSQGTADLGLSDRGIRVGPGMNAASVGDASYHTSSVPIASECLHGRM